MNLRSLLNRELLRKLTIIESLYYSKEAVSVDQIQELNHCSGPVVLNDVASINDSLDFFSIEKQNNSFKLNRPDYVGIDTAYAYFLSQSIEFQLLELLLYEKFPTVKRAANYLFISIPSAHRILNRLSECLRPWNITIQKMPLRMVGNEAMIRHLFYLYYREKKVSVKQLYPREETAAAAQFIIHAFKEANGFTHSSVMQLRLLYNFHISLLRLKNDHPFEEKTLETQSICSPVHKLNDQYASIIRQEYGIEWSPDIQKECLWLYYGKYIIYTKKQLEIAQKESKSIDEISDNTDKYLIYLKRNLQVNWTEDQYIHLKTTILNELIIYRPTRDFLYLIATQRYNFVSTMEERYPCQIQRLFKIYQRFLVENELEVAEDGVFNQIYILLTSCPNILEKLSYYKKKIHLLIISIISPTHEHFLSSYLRNNLMGNYEISHVNLYDYPEKEWRKIIQAYDLILTSFTLSISNVTKPILAVESYPSADRLKKIQRTIMELAEREQ